MNRFVTNGAVGTLLFLCGCIPKAQASASVTVVNNVGIGFDCDVDPLPFDPRADRLRAAVARLAEVAGHSIAFQFDTALLPDYLSGFESALIDAVEHAARDLAELRDRERPVCDRAAPLLKRVECHYDAAAEDDKGSSLARDEKLRRDVAHWLVGRADYFVGGYVHHPELVEAAPATGAFHRAEAAWVAWLNRNLSSLGDSDRLAIAKTVFVRPFNRDADRYGRFLPFAFPGFDPFAFATAIVDDWRAAGYVVETPERPDLSILHAKFVERAQRTPSEARPFENLIEDTAPHSVQMTHAAGSLSQRQTVNGGGSRVLAWQVPPFVQSAFDAH